MSYVFPWWSHSMSKECRDPTDNRHRGSVAPDNGFTVGLKGPSPIQCRPSEFVSGRLSVNCHTSTTLARKWVQGRGPCNPHTNRTDHQAHKTKLETINLWQIREPIREVIQAVYRVGGELGEWNLGPVDFLSHCRVLATFQWASSPYYIFRHWTPPMILSTTENWRRRDAILCGSHLRLHLCVIGVEGISRPWHCLAPRLGAKSQGSWISWKEVFRAVVSRSMSRA
jgi:hypothetical protein